MKVFATQLQGAFQNILSEDEAIENGARLLAQGPAGTGRLLIGGTTSMEGSALTLTQHPDAPVETAFVSLEKPEEAATDDRVLLLAGNAETDTLQAALEKLLEQEIPFVAVAPFAKEEAGVELEPTDVWLQTHVKGGIVPGESGERMGDPSALCSLFAGQLLFLNIKEMLDET
ncbi:DUF2529 family protein [Salibacterium halotolerans]|uniref:DUF2529 domain-containing protein n=1 Tax=Salibacterium halotolerans TaxID=1884432 RepID=A0A1I5V4E0_9BACI|nr:DUF2529 family protein [Salibacterium halotolerans]SFQ02379.1 protein of unknown function [Salibacterium halotolerans]